VVIAPLGLDRRHQRSKIDFERSTEALDVDQGDVAPAALQAADVGDMQTGGFGQRLLRETRESRSDRTAPPNALSKGSGGRVGMAGTLLSSGGARGAENLVRKMVRKLP
jgi:hypothetical protein